MYNASDTAGDVDRAPSSFCTTMWLVVQEAGQADSQRSSEALAQLCHAYWYPLYAFVRRQGYAPEQAQDLTQEFFRRLIEKKSIQAADPARGRFRSFLLSSLRNFLANEWERAQCQKRGGGAVSFSLDAVHAEEQYQLEPTDGRTPETIYDQRWAYALLERVMTRLREEFTESGKADRFELFSTFLLDDNSGSQAEMASQLGITVSAVKSGIHRLRQRYGELLREEVGNTVSRPEDVEREIGELFESLGR